jgi:hypothetical protein
MRMVTIVDRGDAQNMGNVWVLCRNPTPQTLQDSALGTRLAASFGGAKRAFPFLPQWSATSAIKDENSEQNTDAKETQRTLYGFRGVYVFDRLSRDLRPSLCVLDVIRE